MYTYAYAWQLYVSLLYAGLFHFAAVEICTIGSDAASSDAQPTVANYFGFFPTFFVIFAYNPQHLCKVLAKFTLMKISFAANIIRNVENYWTVKNAFTGIALRKFRTDFVAGGEILKVMMKPY